MFKSKKHTKPLIFIMSALLLLTLIIVGKYLWIKLAYDQRDNPYFNVKSQDGKHSARVIDLIPKYAPCSYMGGPPGCIIDKYDILNYLIVDGSRSGLYHKIDNLTFSPDGQIFAFSYQERKGTDEYALLVINGKKQAFPLNHRISSIALGPNNKVVYVLQELNNNINPDEVFVDNKSIGRFYYVNQPLFTSDGQVKFESNHMCYISGVLTPTEHNCSRWLKD